MFHWEAVSLKYLLENNFKVKASPPTLLSIASTNNYKTPVHKLFDFKRNQVRTKFILITNTVKQLNPNHTGCRVIICKKQDREMPKATK